LAKGAPPRPVHSQPAQPPADGLLRTGDTGAGRSPPRAADPAGVRGPLPLGMRGGGRRRRAARAAPRSRAARGAPSSRNGSARPSPRSPTACAARPSTRPSAAPSPPPAPSTRWGHTAAPRSGRWRPRGPRTSRCCGTATRSRMCPTRCAR
jgi:hypothetical protein